MSSRGSGVRAIGLTVVFLAVSAGVSLGSYGLPLALPGVLAGVNLIALGVQMADGPAPIAPTVFPGVGALTAFLRRNLNVVGLIMASSAIAAVAGEAGSALCFAMFALLMLGVSLFTTGFLGA